MLLDTLRVTKLYELEIYYYSIGLLREHSILSSFVLEINTHFTERITLI